MSFVKQANNGEYILLHQTNSNTPHRGKGHKHRTYRDWWFVKYSQNGQKGVVEFGNKTYLPKELVGKHIKLKVEVVE